MPFYEYNCERCNYQFTTQQSIKDDPLTSCGIHCPIQDIGRVKRLISKNIYVIFNNCVSYYYARSYRTIISNYNIFFYN